MTLWDGVYVEMKYCVQQTGRHFNQAQYDQQCKKRAEQCIEKRKAEQEAEIMRTDNMDQIREEFLISSNNKYVKARLRDKVNAELKLHEFSLEDRRDK